MVKLKEFNAKRKLKGAVRAVMAQKTWATMLQEAAKDKKEEEPIVIDLLAGEISAHAQAGARVDVETVLIIGNRYWKKGNRKENLQDDDEGKFLLT